MNIEIYFGKQISNSDSEFDPGTYSLTDKGLPLNLLAYTQKE